MLFFTRLDGQSVDKIRSIVRQRQPKHVHFSSFACLLAAATNFCSGIRRLFCHRRGWDREVLFFVGPLTLTPVGENGPTDSDSFLILSGPRFKRIRTASQSVHFIFFSTCRCLCVCVSVFVRVEAAIDTAACVSSSAPCTPITD